MRAIQGGTYGETKYYGHEHDGASGYRHLRFDYGIRHGIVRDSTPIVNVTPKSHELEKQIRFDISYLRMARVWAENSVAVRKKVGALIVKDGSIISDGYNGMPSGFDNTCEDECGETRWEVLHAEANAITKLAKSTQSSEGATLYITFSPCKQCSKLILQSGITRVVFIDEHSDKSGLELMARAGVEICRYII